MKKYIKPTLEVENIVVNSAIMAVSNLKGQYTEGLILKSKELDLDDEIDEDDEW